MAYLAMTEKGFDVFICDSAQGKEFPKNIRHSHGHCELEAVKKTTWDSESICNHPPPKSMS